MLKTLQRGDTIIEVLLAVTVFSLVSVGSMTIMNRSANAAQQAIETTLVRQQVDAQVEALRASHQAFSRFLTEEAREGSVWRNLVHRIDEQTLEPISIADGCPDQGSLREAFIMNPQSASIMTDDDNAVRSIQDENAPVFPQVTYSDSEGTVGYGLWIEGQRERAESASINDAYDFRVRACWFGPGASEAPMSLETTVRLYDVK